MSGLRFERRRALAPMYAAFAPEGVYKISKSANGKWNVRTPFGGRHVESLSEGKKLAETIRMNSLRRTAKGHASV